MKKLILYIPVSLDGYIAHTYGGFDFCDSIPTIEGEDYDRKAFYDSVDTVIMGGNTYSEVDEICLNNGTVPFKDKKVYVVSYKAIFEFLNTNNEVEFIKENMVEKITELKNQEGKDIWLFGGGILTASLLQENLIDKMIINHMPIMIGSGIPLFPKFNGKSQWKLTNTRTFENNVLQTEYQLIQ